MQENIRLSTGLKICLIIGVVIIFTLLISMEKNTTVNMGNIGLPAEAIDALKRLLGH